MTDQGMPIPGTPAVSLLMRKKPSPVFVADPNSDFLEALWRDPQAQQVPPVVAQNGREAQGLLSQIKQSFSGIFINPDITNPHAVSVVRSAHHYHPAVPIFYISDKSADPSRYSDFELKNLGIQKVIYKPVTFAELLKIVTPPAMIFNPKDALEVSKHNEDPLEKEVEAKDTGFFSTRIENFLTGSKSFFDIYVKLSSGRYIKILQAGDTFAVDRLMNYINRGVTHLYLRKEAQEHYLNFCDKLVAAIIKSPKVSTEVKLTQTFHHGEKTINYLQDHGLSPTSLEYASSFVGNVEELVKQLNLSQNKAMKPFLDDLVAYDHGVGVSIVAALIGKALDMENQRAVYTVGLASLLHDIGLQSLPAALKKEDESQMTESERKFYEMHPTTGAKVLEKIPGIDPIVPQSVEQHHERKNRSGFPKQLGSSSILQVAEIVGISDEFFRLIQRKAIDPNLDPFVSMLTVFDGFSVPIVQAFRGIFMENR